ncbi:helix-turn-helix domain-containing protein [Draconibacterium sp.]|nr:helix-turn-helix domain-containing protein [Draconibacterium sp.]
MQTNGNKAVLSMRQAVALAASKGMPAGAATLRAHASAGAFEYAKTPGGHWRIPKQSFLQWLTVDRFSKTTTAA